MYVYVYCFVLFKSIEQHFSLIRMVCLAKHTHTYTQTHAFGVTLVSWCFYLPLLSFILAYRDNFPSLRDATYKICIKMNLITNWQQGNSRDAILCAAAYSTVIQT